MELYYNQDTNRYNKIYNVAEITVALLRSEILSPYMVKKRTHSVTSTKFQQKQIGKHKSYLNISAGFDIETTSTDNGGYMYIWQFGLCHSVIIGRTWQDFVKFLSILDEAIDFKKDAQTVIVWVHNLGFEFQFLKSVLSDYYSNDSFFKEERKPLYVKYLHFMFKDSLAMTNTSLSKLAKTYCVTQKLKGDLDYSIPRNQYTELNKEHELPYCYNDVIILCEWADDYWERHIMNGSVPLTITSILNNEVKREYRNKYGYSKYTDQSLFLKKCWFKSYDEVAFFMKWAYRGGYVHAIQDYCGITFNKDDNIFSFDIGSSYPTVMLVEKYPTYFIKSVKKTEDKLNDLIAKGKVFFADITFKNIRSTTPHSIESSNKCIELVNEKIDNGRVRKADKMRVVLLSPDWLSYNEFYDWDECEVHYIYYSPTMKLPSYLIKPMVKYGAKKNILKREGKPYAHEKSMFNTFYGLCCKGIEPVTTKFDGENFYESENLNWDRVTDGVLLPQWGAFISAYARRNLLSMVYQLTSAGYDCIYMDTDSIKILGYDEKAQKIIDEYNARISKRISEAFDYYDVEKEYRDALNDLGRFDCEGHMEKFKTLGAKRYIYVKDGELHQTVAGLPKTQMVDGKPVTTLLAKFGTINKCFKEFNDKLEIVECGKLASIYYDEPTVNYVAGVKMYSSSSISLVPCDFTLKIDPDWWNNVKLLQASIEVAKGKKW